jgi:hypothetical protein
MGKSLQVTTHSIREGRRQLAVLDAQAEACRATDATARGVDAGSYPVAMIPLTEGAVLPLAAERRARFLEGLRSEIAASASLDQERVGERESGSHGASGSHAAAVHAVTVAVCSACRGDCCTAGADHAFLRREWLAQARTISGLDDSSLLEWYEARLPRETIAGGCVFQSAEGCTIEREMRAPICNRYLCRGLRSAIECTDGGTAGVYVIHRRKQELSGGRFIPL